MDKNHEFHLLTCLFMSNMEDEMTKDQDGGCGMMKGEMVEGCCYKQ